MLIDSHHHLWHYSSAEYGWISDEMSAIRRDFLTADLQQIAADHGVDRFVTVQARQTLEETRWLLELAEQEPLIGGVVGWAPLASPDIADQLEPLAGSRWLKGIRHVVQDEPDDRFLLRDDFNRGVAALKNFQLVYDVLVFARQLPAAIEFADRHPDQPLVLDHIAKPTIREAEFDRKWERDFRELARRDNVTCKFSGVATEVRDDSWSIETVRPYWDVALEAFSPERLMFGSDWPVCLLATDYGRWLATVRELAGELSSDEQAALMAGNAARLYNLGHE